MIKNKSLIELKKELQFLYTVAQSVHSLEIDELLKEIVKLASEISKADSCLIYILDTNKNELVLRASKNPHADLLQRITMKLGEGITGWVAKEKTEVAISKGANRDARFKFFRSLPEDRFEAFLSVPIVYKRNVTGVINVQHQKKHAHTKMEINLLTAIGKLVGGAVENALLVEQSMVLKEALEFRKVIEKAKGVLMKKNNLSENEAYRMLQKESMNSRKSFKEVAEAVILADRLKLGS
ncbi:GAF and ANTAR domain-containing protein [Candidatus Gottesmanbacteria bacterium]|nr:GAF and ANTAR domain-containing protein [Candidatus Gottesmanbacteria bacterium]